MHFCFAAFFTFAYRLQPSKPGILIIQKTCTKDANNLLHILSFYVVHYFLLFIIVEDNNHILPCYNLWL